MAPVPMSMTPRKSFKVSKGRLGYRLGLTPWVSNTITQVYPSAGALAANAVPIVPEAPALVSITMACPRLCCTKGCNKREI